MNLLKFEVCVEVQSPHWILKCLSKIKARVEVWSTNWSPKCKLKEEALVDVVNISMTTLFQSIAKENAYFRDEFRCKIEYFRWIFGLNWPQNHKKICGLVLSGPKKIWKKIWPDLPLNHLIELLGWSLISENSSCYWKSMISHLFNFCYRIKTQSGKKIFCFAKMITFFITDITA